MPTTLFLLDLCHAEGGEPHWQPPKRRTEQRAWVIAAAGADRIRRRGRRAPGWTRTTPQRWGYPGSKGRALIAAADADTGRARLRYAAVIRLLLHTALRVDEALGADIADLGTDRGHQNLTVLGEGNRRAKFAPRG